MKEMVKYYRLPTSKSDQNEIDTLIPLIYVSGLDNKYKIKIIKGANPLIHPSFIKITLL